MNVLAAGGLLIAAAVLGVLVPWLGVRMLEPSLADAPGAQATNYRGARVLYGLGVAWLLWAGGAIIGGVASSLLVGESTLAILTLAGPLALVAFALGLLDDAYGTAGERGFRGHVSALARGRLTTGGLKLLGISLASYVVALVLAEVAPWGATAMSGDVSELGLVLLALPAGAAIALTSNFMNLVDLRPGRALKAYAVLGALGVGSTAWLLGRGPLARQAGVTPAEVGLDAAVLALFVAGPIVATWSADLGERGMLGDAGANPAGAVAGLLIVAGLPLWGLVLYLALLLALNLASERFSFSSAIERSALLSRIDALGRSHPSRAAGALGGEPPGWDEKRDAEISPHSGPPSGDASE